MSGDPVVNTELVLGVKPIYSVSSCLLSCLGLASPLGASLAECERGGRKRDLIWCCFRSVCAPIDNLIPDEVECIEIPLYDPHMFFLFHFLLCCIFFLLFFLANPGQLRSPSPFLGDPLQLLEGKAL